jgi:hypothetical protein
MHPIRIPHHPHREPPRPAIHPLSRGPLGVHHPHPPFPSRLQYRRGRSTLFPGRRPVEVKEPISRIRVKEPVAVMEAMAGPRCKPVELMEAMGGAGRKPVEVMEAVSGPSRKPVEVMEAVGGPRRKPAVEVMEAVGGVGRTPVQVMQTIGGPGRTPLQVMQTMEVMEAVGDGGTRPVPMAVRVGIRKPVEVTGGTRPVPMAVRVRHGRCRIGGPGGNYVTRCRGEFTHCCGV